MKKILSLVSSAALAVAVALPTPAAAQTMKKLSGARNGRAVQQTAQAPKPSPKGFHVAKARSLNASTPSLHRAMQAAGLRTGVKSLKAAAAEGTLPNLQGSVTFNESFTQESAPIGLYKVVQGGTELIFEGPRAQYGGVAVDGVYYTTEYTDYGFIAWTTITAYDLETQEEIGTIDGEVDNLAIAGPVVDPTTGDVYAITYNATGDGLQLSKMTYTTSGVTSTAIAAMEGNWNSLVCDAAGQLYGINYTGVTSGQSFTATASFLNKIDKATGAVTLIGETGQLPQYLSSAAIDTKTGRMFWNVCPPDETGIICEVNLTTGVATKLFDLEYNDEIMGMFVAQPDAEADAPATVTDLQASFPEGALSGTVSFTAPTTLFDGTAATGALTYKVLANGESVATGSTTFGAAVSAPVTVAAAGDYTFVVTVANDKGDSPKAKTTLFVGRGTPAAPTATLAYEGGKMKLSWTAVTTTVDGGYINPAAVTYKVTRFPGAVVVAEATAATTFEESIAAPAEITQYYYTVEADAEGALSAVATSNIVTLGSIVPPYSNDFDDDSALSGWTIIDANNDGRKWSIYDHKARMSYNSSKAMDDWMITPPLQLEAGKAYQVSFKASANGTSFPERLEVKWGSAATAAGMTETILAPTVLSSKDLEDFTEFIVPEADGVYYIGFHGISDEDMYYLYVDDFSISAGMATTSPGAVTDLKATPDANGAYKATISFVTPTVDFAGAALGSITKAELSRDGNVIKTWDNPATGAALSFEDSMEEGGTVTYTVVCSNATGAGKPASISAFIGVDKPAAPTGVHAAETATDGELTVTWDAVTTDQNGNAINPDLVSYTVATYESGWTPVEGGTGIHGTSFTFQAVPAGQQDFVQVAVFAETDGGMAGASDPQGLIAVGTPFAGLEESFAGGNLSYPFGTGYSEGTQGQWGIYTDEDLDIAAQDGDNGFAGMQGRSIDYTAGLFTGKVSLAGMQNPGISLYTYNITSEAGEANDLNEIQFYVKTPAAADWTALGTAVAVNSLSDEEGWALLTASLADYAGQTIQVRIQATTKAYAYTLVDNLKIGSLLGHDLNARSISAPSTVAAGADYKVNVSVANAGMQPATEFSVELYADGELADTKTVDALASGKSTTVEFDRTMSAVADKPVDYYAVVKYTADENNDNNTTENIAVAPKLSNLPKVTDLKGEDTAEGVKLTWSEPDLSNAPAEPVLFDFEDENSWAMEIDGWTFVDGDQSPIGGFQNTDLPGITPGETTASFFVFDAAEFNFTFSAHSGTKYLAALFRYDDGTTDDWVISPALDGNAQTISFWARSYSNDYPEKIEMLYSTGSTNTEDFVKVSAVNAVPSGYNSDQTASVWTQYTFDVPAGAKYFAIRSCATGSFMLELDDISFVPAGVSAELTLVGYDVYRDGVKITAEPTGETEFVDTEATDGDHSYVVITVYDRGVSAPSNAVTVAATGINDALAAGISISAGKGSITVAGAEGQTLSVAAVDGKVVYTATAAARTTVNVAAGVYVVKAGNKIVKVAVK